MSEEMTKSLNYDVSIKGYDLIFPEEYNKFIEQVENLRDENGDLAFDSDKQDLITDKVTMTYFASEMIRNFSKLLSQNLLGDPYYLDTNDPKLPSIIVTVENLTDYNVTYNLLSSSEAILHSPYTSNLLTDLLEAKPSYNVNFHRNNDDSLDIRGIDIGFVALIPISNLCASYTISRTLNSIQRKFVTPIVYEHHQI